MRTIILFLLTSAAAYAQCGAYGHCADITIDHTKIGGSGISNYVLTINETQTYFKVSGSGGQILTTGTQSGGRSFTIPYDFVLTAAGSSCGTILTAGEIEDYDGSTGKLVGYWLSGALSNSVDTVVRACWGKASDTQHHTVSSAWASAYKYVAHMATTGLVDSTSNGNTATAGACVSATTGVIDGGMACNGTEGPITVNHGLTDMIGASATWTVSFWLNCSSVPTAATIWDGVGVSSSLGAALNVNNPTQLSWLLTGAQTFTISSVAPATMVGNWNYIVLEKNASGDNTTFYFNGVPVTRDSGSGVTDVASVGSNKTLLFNFSAGGFPPLCSVDEYRVTNDQRGSRSLAEYNNGLNSTKAFYSLGSDLGTGGSPAVPHRRIL